MLIKDAVFRIFDTETTGFDPKKDKVVEIAWMDCDFAEKELICIDAKEHFCNPGMPIPVEAMAIHNIQDKMVANAPALKTIIDENNFIDVGDESGYVVHVAFNADFDVPFINATHPAVEMITSDYIVCVMRIARHLWPEAPKHSNACLRYWLGLLLDVNIDLHRAAGDVAITAAIFERELRILTERGMTRVEELVEFSAKPIHMGTCKFGAKHFGELWDKVPTSYMQWMLREVKDLDKDTRWNIESRISARNKR